MRPSGLRGWGLDGIPRHSAALALGMLVLACWRVPSHFFWRDEWGFLVGLSGPDPVAWLSPHGGHVFPLFKAAYFWLLLAFGNNAQGFHYLALLVWWGVGLVAFRIARALLGRDDAALSVAAVLVVHPVNSTAVLWSFEMCVTLQLFFQLLAILTVVRNPQRPMLFTLGTLLFLQNFFFANGALFPLVCLCVPGAWRRDRAILCTAGAVLFVALQLWLGGTGAVNLSSLPASWFWYSVTTVGRLLLIYERIFGAWILLPAILALALVIVAARRSRDYATLLFLIVWYGATSAALVLGRGPTAAATGSPLYYTTLTAFPVLLLLFWALARGTAPTTAQRRLFSPVVTLGLLTILLAISQRAVTTFTQRSVLNEASIRAAIRQNVRWIPFDDPVIDSSNGMRVDAELAKRAYLYFAR